MQTTLAAAIENAKILAITRLVRIVQESKSDHEARLAAEALLAIKPDRIAATPSSQRGSNPPPNPTPPANTPLTDVELAELRRLLPHVRPERFTRKHRPSHWRSVLAQHSVPTPLRHAG